MLFKKPDVNTLKRMRELLSNPARWYQHSFTNSPHLELELLHRHSHDETLCFCLLGAGYAAAEVENENLNPYSVGRQAYDVEVNSLLVDCMGTGWAPDFNDRKSTTHADVLKVLDCAIERHSQP